MKKNKKFLAAFLAAAFVIPLGAQTSRTNTVTQGLFDTEIDKFFGLLGGSLGPADVRGGLAFKPGSLYLGIYYAGNLLTGNEIEARDADGDWITPAPNDTGFTFTDRVDLLFGTAVGGFKASVYFNGFGFDTDEDMAQTVKATAGNIALGLAWGKNIALGGGLLKPEVEANYAINMSKTEQTLTGSPVTSIQTPGASTLTARVSADYIFAKTGNSQAVLSLSDTLALDIYKDPQSDNGAPIATTTHREGMPVRNGFTLTFSKTYEIDDRFSAGWKAGGGFNLSVAPDKQVTKINFPGIADTINQDQTTTTITLSPQAGLGFTYAFVPDRFSLNGGVGVSFTYTNESFENKLAAAGTVKKRTTNQFSALSPSAGLGGTLVINPNMNFDFSVTTTASSGFFTINATSVSLLATIKK